MLDRCEWVRRRCDHLRRAFMREPRGHADMYGAVLTEPAEPGSQAGVLFMHTDGYSAMCGHGVIGVVTIALERGLLHLSDSTDIRLDTPAGTIQVVAIHHGARVDKVSFVGMPSFVLFPGLRLLLGARDLRVDVAFGGEFYAIVDSESAGVPVQPGYLAELRNLGRRIKDEVDSLLAVAHPEIPRLRGLCGTIFTGLPNTEDADLRSVTVFAHGQVDRSPCGSGTGAVMAVLDAMGLLPASRPFIHEGITGARFTGTVESRTTVRDLSAVVARIEGSAWITGEHEFLINDDDPLRDGFRM